MMETIAWLGFSHSLFLAILMLAKKEQGVSDKVLTAWLSLLSIEFLTFVIDTKVFGIPLLSSSFLLFNPAFFIYTQTLIGGKFKLGYIQLLHLFPFLFFEIFAYIIKEPYTLTAFFDANKTLWFRYSFAIASLLSWLAYNWATFHMIFRHRKRLKNEFSNIESNKRVGWLAFIVVFYNFYCMVAMAIAGFVILFGINFPLSPIYNYSTLLLLIFILGFYGIRQEEIYAKSALEEQTDDRYSKSSLSDDLKMDIQVRLKEYVRQKQPYLNPDLSMSMLSGALNVPKYQLTEVLNSVIGKNFFQFVNEYRVEAVKKMLVKKPHYSIEAVGYECGFNSKSSFYTVFKNLTGQTPMQYKQMIKNDRE
jgi:AraC-like DNA-binding protein